LEDVIESKGAKNTVGVVFVDRRISALALYDYFRNRRKGVADGTWVRVKDTEFNRKPTEQADLSFAPRLAKNGPIDLSNRQFQDMNFCADELDAAIINDVLQDALPEGMDLDTLMDIEPSPLFNGGGSASLETSKQHRTIRW